MSAKRSRAVNKKRKPSRRGVELDRRGRTNRRRQLGRALESLEGRLLLAFSANVFADINQLGISSNVESLVEFDGRAFFSADDGQNGSELWTSDGTTAGTTLFADLLPGTDGSLPTDLTVVGTELFFTARDESGESDLWKTDGTVEGTEIVFDANEVGVYGLERLTESGGKLFFTAYQIDTDPGPGDNATGQELWVSNGTSAGTMLLLDINPDQAAYGGEGPQELTDHNGTLFFTSYDSDFNRDLWKSDGTTATTIKVADLEDLNTSELTSVGTNLFFAAETPTNGMELYVYDGTTTTLLDVNTGFGSSSPQDITSFSGQAFFSAEGSSGSRLLFRSDGTSVSPVTGGLLVNDPAHLTVVGSTLLFAGTNTTFGRELWKSDGTTNSLVEDIVPGGDSNPSELTAVGPRLYFSADDATAFGRELWVSQGTFVAGSTNRLSNTFTGNDAMGAPNDGNPQDLVSALGRLFFTSEDNSGDRELWTSQGSSGTTVLRKDINPSTRDANVEQVVVLGTDIYFVADDGVNGQAVYVADTTSPGSVTMIDVTPGTAAETISGLSIQDTGGETSIWFYNNLAGGEGAIYRINGTTPTQVAQRTPIPLSDDPNDLFTTYVTSGTTQGRVYFSSEDDQGIELWRTNNAGTTVARFQNIFTGNNDQGRPNSSFPRHLEVVNGLLYFAATDGTNGRELWSSDGTGGGTNPINIAADPAPPANPISSNPEFLTASGSNLFFVADDNIAGEELYVIRPGEAPELIEIDAGADGSFPINLTDIGGVLYFSADTDNGEFDKEPYKSDGINTTLIQNINTTANQGSNPSGFVDLGGTVYFAATSTNDGVELYRTTATAAEIVQDVPGSASPQELAVAGGRVFYSAVDENESDRELWTAGGPLASGSAQVLDQFPGVFQGGRPTDIVEVGGDIYFVGKDETSGRELFVLEEFSPEVESVVINDGSAQRSQITSVTVTFNGLVDPAAAAFQLTNIDTTTTVTNVQVDVSVQGSKTVAVLTFGDGGDSVQDRTELLNSLADGNYRLNVLGAQVTDPTTGAAISDFVFGGQTAADEPNDDFFRLFGDTSGDGNVNFGDFATGFLPAFGSVPGDDNFNPDVDGNGDEIINFTDFASFFLPNFGKMRS